MRITPDGRHYLAMAGGVAQPMPYHVRRGLPMICGTSKRRWKVANTISTLAAAWLIGCLAVLHGATPYQAAFAAALFLGLPWVRFCVECPVLVDMPGLAGALFAAVAWLSGYQPLALVAVCVAAPISEKAPIWAALFAWHPVLLAGLIVPLVVRCILKPAEPDAGDVELTHPLRAGLDWPKKKWRDPLAMVMPWGMCLAALLALTLPLCVALLIGYAQLLVATDTVRLYQQAAPVVCVAAAMVIPIEFAPLALVAHWFNPLRGTGV